MTNICTERQKLIAKYTKPTYIGDSVYVHFDGYHFILEIRNALPNDPSNTIALEPDVIENLLNHRLEVYENFRLLREWEVEQQTNDEKKGKALC